MNCDITREQLIAYLYDEDIRPEARERLKDHIETCPSCSQTLKNWAAHLASSTPGATKNPTWTSSSCKNANPLAKPVSHATSQNLGCCGSWICHRRNPHLHLSQHRICHTRRRIHAAIGLRSSAPLEQTAIANTTEVPSLNAPITLGEYIIHQQNLIDYTNRLVQTSQNQQRNEINNTFIRLVSELETQRQQDPPAH